jgi:hypothetical protein
MQSQYDLAAKTNSERRVIAHFFHPKYTVGLKYSPHWSLEAGCSGGGVSQRVIIIAAAAVEPVFLFAANLYS